MLRSNSSDDIDFDELVEEQQKESQFVEYLEGKLPQNNSFASVVKEIGSFVVFLYEGKLYPGEIVSFDNNEVTINAMEKSIKMWKWPAKRDVLSYPRSDVLGGIKPPKQISKRGFFAVPELENHFFK